MDDLRRPQTPDLARIRHGGDPQTLDLARIHIETGSQTPKMAYFGPPFWRVLEAHDLGPPI